MPYKKFNDEWEALPDIYKRSFLEILEERGLTKDFDLLPDEYKSQILEIIKTHVLADVTSPGVDAPVSDLPTNQNS